MYTFSWAPKEAKVERDGKEIIIEPMFTGSVELKAAKYEDRMDYLQQISMDFEDGKADLLPANSVKRLKNMIAIAKKHIIKIDLKRKSDGYEFNDVEQLEYDGDGGLLLLQIANEIAQGFTLGEHVKKSSSAK